MPWLNRFTLIFQCKISLWEAFNYAIYPLYNGHNGQRLLMNSQCVAQWSSLKARWEPTTMASPMATRLQLWVITHWTFVGSRQLQRATGYGQRAMATVSHNIKNVNQRQLTDSNPIRAPQWSTCYECDDALSTLEATPSAVSSRQSRKCGNNSRRRGAHIGGCRKARHKCRNICLDVAPPLSSTAPYSTAQDRSITKCCSSYMPGILDTQRQWLLSRLCLCLCPCVWSRRGASAVASS